MASPVAADHFRHDHHYHYYSLHWGGQTGPPGTPAPCVP